MTKNRKKSEKGSRIVVILLGVFLLLWCGADISLNVFGKVTDARDITASRRKMGRSDISGDSKNYRFDVSYTYTVDGVDYDGLDTGIRGEWLGPEWDGTVHYFPFAPRISSMYADDALSDGMKISVIFALALILLGILSRKKPKRNKDGTSADIIGEALASDQPVTMAWLMENTEGYDDRLEEYYQNGWDQGDPSWKCSCGKWNIGNFCENCGAFRK